MSNESTISASTCRSLPQPAFSRGQHWSEPELLEICAAHRAPRAPGVVLLFPNDRSRPPVFWAGVTPNIQERLDEMLRSPQDDQVLESLLAPYPRDVSFRYLVVPSARRRARLLQSITSAPKPRRAPAEAARSTR
jgi:hypothetical protein